MPGETQFADDLICPYCGYVEQDVWELDFGAGFDGDAEVTCAACGEEYHAERHCAVSYSTRMMDVPF